MVPADAKIHALKAWPADRVERWPLDKLIPYARNARTHSDEQVAQIAASMREWGWTNPVLVDEAGLIIAGHGRVSAARLLGLGEAPVMVATGWSEAQKRAYTLADNKLALNAGWDPAMLALELGELGDLGVDLNLAGFTDEEIERLTSLGTAGKTDPDDVPPTPAEPVTRLGDVWQLGRHRLICGDATNSDDWAKLNIGDGFVVFTSPPYNVGDASGLRDKYKPGVPKTRKLYDKYTDDLSGDDYVGLLSDTLAAAFAFVDAAAINVQPLAGAKRPLMRWMHDYSTHLVDVITWDKGRGAPHIQPGIMTSRYEWIVVFSREENASRVIPHSSWQGKFANVYQSPPQTANKFASIHGATFPSHLPEYIIGDLMNRSRGVVDCFCGTGTTIIAAETLGREGRGIELSPAYVDVSVVRWQQFTGGAATLEGDGRTFDVLHSERTENGQSLA